MYLYQVSFSHSRAKLILQFLRHLQTITSSTRLRFLPSFHCNLIE